MFFVPEVGLNLVARRIRGPALLNQVCATSVASPLSTAQVISPSFSARKADATAFQQVTNSKGTASAFLLRSARSALMTERTMPGSSQQQAQVSEASEILRDAAARATAPPSPERLSELLAQWTRQAPLAALAIAFLLGYRIARRR